MTVLDRLQRRFGRFAVPQVTVALIFCQVFVYVVSLTAPQMAILQRLELVPKFVLEGEVWRLVSFLFCPRLGHPLFAFFFWYLFYLMGTALEQTWGVFRYNVYLGVGYLATVAAAFLQPDSAASVAFLQGSVYLAFAYLYPNFTLMLFFLLPVKIKWLALAAWIGYGLALAFGTWHARLLVTASIANFLLFFGREIWLGAKTGRWVMANQVRQIKAKNKPIHTCRVCGVTDKMDRKMRFRYCSKCEGNCCYCSEHLHNHEHVAAEGEGA
ncbi:MAG: rhomboid family intramembrane serine protease [Candidatus Nealsonbacteria bacterium]|nr:rhomboid family intramembrane serine protease [Candidatus Nealsonbacteria bacterium]